MTGDDASVVEAQIRAQSLWLDVLPGQLTPRDPVEGERTCDVVIVGGGYTGLWTAYALACAAPGLEIAVVEAEICGFGASGRNGGFVSAGIAGQAAVYERSHGLGAVIDAERVMVEGIDEIGSVVGAEAIDCGWVKGGSLRVALNAPQLARIAGGLREKRRRGLDERDAHALDRDGVRDRVAIEGVIGGSFTPHCARVNPAALARGLADACERRGVSIYEQTRAATVGEGCVVTAGGALRAPVVIRATEAFTTRLAGLRRTFLALGSYMVASEPLPADVWADLGWSGRETVADQRHHFVYAQRTPDDRIALGGGGLSYRFANGLTAANEHDVQIHRRLEATLRVLFPAAAEARVTHRWGGVFAAPRDWSMGLGFDRSTGLGWAGGYSGHGVVASSVAGRTLADLVLGRETRLTRLPWVGHRSRLWEPEPLRWLGARLVSGVLASADRTELRTGRPARRLRLVARWAPDR